MVFLPAWNRCTWFWFVSLTLLPIVVQLFACCVWPSMVLRCLHATGAYGSNTTHFVACVILLLGEILNARSDKNLNARSDKNRDTLWDLSRFAFPGPSVEPGAPTEGGLTPVTQKPKLEWKEKVSSSMRSPAESLWVTVPAQSIILGPKFGSQDTICLFLFSDALLCLCELPPCFLAPRFTFDLQA